jgi:hypothetical protein
MSLFKVEVYIDENYLKTVIIDAESQYEAEDQVREGLNIDLDSELVDA